MKKLYALFTLAAALIAAELSAMFGPAARQASRIGLRQYHMQVPGATATGSLLKTGVPATLRSIKDSLVSAARARKAQIDASTQATWQRARQKGANFAQKAKKVGFYSTIAGAGALPVGIGLAYNQRQLDKKQQKLAQEIEVKERLITNELLHPNPNKEGTYLKILNISEKNKPTQPAKSATTGRYGEPVREAYKHGIEQFQQDRYIEETILTNDLSKLTNYVLQEEISPIAAAKVLEKYNKIHSLTDRLGKYPQVDASMKSFVGAINSVGSGEAQAILYEMLGEQAQKDKPISSWTWLGKGTREEKARKALVNNLMRRFSYGTKIGAMLPKNISDSSDADASLISHIEGF